MDTDNHPLRLSKLAQEIEKVLLRRSLVQRLGGYTLETALEIADVIVGLHITKNDPLDEDTMHGLDMRRLTGRE